MRIAGRKRTFVAVMTTAVLVGLCTPAWAHVTVHPTALKKGASDQLLNFAVPNEETGATTTKFEIDFPTDHPILGLHPQMMAGWSTTVETVKLQKPVTTDDGQITEAVSKITWTANGPGIGQNEFAMFTVLAGTLPSDTGTLTFKAIQTYNNGDVVSWIEPVVKGTPEPEHPAPMLRLTGKRAKK
jgi:uncharacterized protein YcnI